MQTLLELANEFYRETRNENKRALAQPKAFLRFMKKVAVDPSTGCHYWTGAKWDSGYGQFWLNGKLQRAHRVAYMNVHGPLELDLHHKCENKSCVEVDHLEPTTRAGNIKKPDGCAGINSAKTHCPQGHPLVEGNLVLYKLKQGWRECLTCSREHKRAWAARQRGESK